MNLVLSIIALIVIYYIFKDSIEGLSMGPLFDFSSSMEGMSPGTIIDLQANTKYLDGPVKGTLPYYQLPMSFSKDPYFFKRNTGAGPYPMYQLTEIV